MLEQLREELAGARATILWDGLMSHRSRQMRKFIATQRRWLVVQRLPGYAPELNPVEGLWSCLKGRDLANVCCDTLDEITTAAWEGAERIAKSRELLFGFLRQARLSLD